MQAPPERLGSFFLGAEYDLKAGERTENPINYDARDLTTHAVCVGMTAAAKPDCVSACWKRQPWTASQLF